MWVGGRLAFGLYCLHGNLNWGVGGTLGLSDQQELVSMQERWESPRMKQNVFKILLFWRLSTETDL